MTHPAGARIFARGIVQGVGFRPFVYSLAVQNNLTGWVRNTSSGVEIELNGSPSAIQTFIDTLQHNPPPLARIDELRVDPCPANSYTQFEIISSQPQPDDFLPVSPDVALCPDCRRELLNPADRRFHYPFINCTHCGPRFTIIRDIPYDRPKTTMAGFEMCPQCSAEYHNPLDRRFHAQPTACPVCGPQVSFVTGGHLQAQGEAALQTARAWLQSGKILAVKGLGGYHLACDASNHQAVTALRNRKKRSDKPFALMAPDLQTVHRHCCLSDEEAALLQSRAAPIVLLQKRPDSNIADGVAPYQNTLGVMLAYTPLHVLLLEPAPDFPEMLVMTSGNLSEEPIAYDDEDAQIRLASIADGFLLHDRPIHMRMDDSVARVISGAPYLLRRSRGYAPDSISLHESVPPILAAGAELKNTFCLTRDRYAFMSHHIGDLENLETLRSFEDGIAHFEHLFRIQPQAIACDLHPDYLATRYAQRRAADQGLPLIAVQHHHAHLAACLADNEWHETEPVIGLTFDGTGLGTDGAVWGGEVLLGGYTTFQRIAHLKYTPLPGGDLAVRRPARMALAHLWQAGLDWEPDLPPVQSLCYEERTALRGQLEHHLNTPPTSSMGRLFDAAAALVGGRQIATYEGQAAIDFEAAAAPNEHGAYEFAIHNDILDPAPVWETLLADWRAGVPLPVLSARFHNSVVNLSITCCKAIRRTCGVQSVALSGGVWQNKYLLEHTLRGLEKEGFNVLIHRRVPANDGGLALGQALIAAHSMR